MSGAAGPAPRRIFGCEACRSKRAGEILHRPSELLRRKGRAAPGPRIVEGAQARRTDVPRHEVRSDLVDDYLRLAELVRASLAASTSLMWSHHTSYCANRSRCAATTPVRIQ